MKYVRGNRASICHWKLSVTFLTKDQCQKFLKEYMKNENGDDVRYFKEITNTGEKFHLEISGCWANNLKAVSKILEKYDYS